MLSYGKYPIFMCPQDYKYLGINVTTNEHIERKLYKFIERHRAKPNQW